MRKSVWFSVLMSLAILAMVLVGARMAHAGEPVLSFALSGNAVWFDDPGPFPTDVEFGGNAAASLTPHISAVGAAYYLLDNSMVIGKIGGRFTLTDVADPNFSIGVGASYQASSEPAVRPEEALAEVAFGWRPWPGTQPRLIIAGIGDRGFRTGAAAVHLGVRIALGRTS